MGIVTVYDTWYGPVVDGDAETLSVHTTEYDCVPDEYDKEDCRETPVEMAVWIIRDKHYMSGPYCASGLSGDGSWPGPGTWFAAEPYGHPYEDKRQEVTAHLEGWTDAEAREIWQGVTA